MESNKLFVVTGAGRGTSVGGSAVNSLLKRGENVLSVGRSPASERTGHSDLTNEQQARLMHAQLDLSTPENVIKLVQEIGMAMEGTRSELACVIASLGTGNLDHDLGNNPELRANQRFLNVEGPYLLAKELMNERLLTRKSLFVYISALFTSKALQGMLDGVVDQFTKDKLDASAMLRKRLASNSKAAYTEVVMGEVEGEMMKKYMAGSESDGLVPHAAPAWFMGLPADPNRKGGVGDQLAKLALTPAKQAPDILETPKLSKLLGRVPAGILKTVFPYILQSSAPAVAEYYGVTKEDFDRCIEWHMEQGTHPGINLRKAASKNWWPLFMSRANVKAADWVLNT